MIDPHNRPALSDGDVTLRAPQPRDVAVRVAQGRSKEISRCYGIVGDLAPFTAEHGERWLADQLKHPRAFVIEYKGELSGSIRLDSLDPTDNRATLAVGLFETAKLGQGIGTAAMRVLLDYAFGPLGLNRVSLRVLHDNARAIAAYQKLGFQHEGVERQSARVGDEYHDDIMMGLLASEWHR